MLNSNYIVRKVNKLGKVHKLAEVFVLTILSENTSYWIKWFYKFPTIEGWMWDKTINEFVDAKVVMEKDGKCSSPWLTARAFFFF